MKRAQPWAAVVRHVGVGKAVVFVATIALVIGGIAAAGDDLAHHLSAIEAAIAGSGLWGPILFIGLFVVATTLLLPESLLGIVAGATFGLPVGFAAAVAANLFAACLQYWLARTLLLRYTKRAIDARPTLRAIQAAVLASEFKLQLLLRLTPLNPATLSYVLGAAGVRFTTFALATFAFVPHTFAEVYVGFAAKHVARMAARDAGATSAHLHDSIVFVMLIATVVVLVLVSRAALRAVKETIGAGTPTR